MHAQTRLKVSSAMIGLIAAAAVTPGVAHAQGTEQAQEQPPENGNVIVVTARKQDENLLRVPVAVTAFDEEAIEERGLVNIEDVAAFTPGFTFESQQTTPGRFDSGPRFRGVGVNTGSPTRQTASIFVDGVFVANGAQGLGFGDIAQVEVIKGPQSAYFGRNTFGGAVNYITKTPGDDFAVDYSLTAATRDLYDGYVAIEGPIVEDVLKFRVGGGYRYQGGHYTNSVDGSELGREETWSINGTLYVEPSPEFDAKIRVAYFENNDGPAAVSLTGLPSHNCGPFTTDGVTGTDTTLCGPAEPSTPGLNTNLPDSFFAFLDDRIYINGSPRDSFGFDRESLRASLQFNVRPTDGLEISWLTGLNYDESNLLQDADYSPDNAFAAYNARQFRDFSQEIRISGSAFNERLDWNVGGNYFDQRFTSNGGFVVPTLGNLTFDPGFPDEEQIETFGIFGGFTFDITDTVSIIGEARYQWDKIAEDGNIQDNVDFEKGTFEAFLPRVILNWQATPDTLVYASYSEGNLPGGFNSDLSELDAGQLTALRAIEPSADPLFTEETLKNYEVGLKHGFGNNGYVAIAAFYMERTGQAARRSDVIFPGTPDQLQLNYFINIGESEIKGVEFEGVYEFVPGFSVGANLAYVDSINTVFDSSGVYAEVFGTIDASGTRADKYPKWQGGGFAQFEGALNADMDWFIRGDAAFQSKRFTDETNVTFADDGIQANLRAGVKMENVRIEAFVTNITDDDTPTAVNRSRDLSFNTPLFDFSTFGWSVALRDRRQFGLRLTGEF